jgi:hypothetical protein
MTEENTHLADAIEIAADKAKYDAEVKKILSDKRVLAWILRGTATEFQNTSIEEIMECIEGEPQVASIPVNPGKTNQEAIQGLPTEDKTPTEGEITYDIRPERNRVHRGRLR